MSENATDSSDGPIAAQTANDIREHSRLFDAAKELITPELPPERLFSLLVEKGLQTDALRLLPFIIPIRHAVWWSCVCVWHGLAGRPNESDDLALCATVRWVQEPSAENQAIADRASTGLSSSAKICAKAAFWAGSFTKPVAGDPTLKPWKGDAAMWMQSQPNAGVGWSAADVNAAARLSATAALHTLVTAPSPVNSLQLLSFGVEVAQRRLLWTHS